MTGPNAPFRLPVGAFAGGFVVGAVLLAGTPGWAQGYGQQPAPQGGPFAFGVPPGDGGAPPYGQQPQPGYGPQPGYAPPQGYNPGPAPYPATPYGSQPQFGGGQPQQPYPQQPPGQFPQQSPPQYPGQPVAGGPGPQQLQQLAGAEREDYGVPAPRQLHGGAPHAPTPNSLPGGQLITTLGLVSLLQQPGLRPVLLDALGGPSHLPGALPAAFAAQPGSFSDGVQQQLAGLLQQATDGDRTRPIVVYCSDPHCWMSYNAALRAVALQYRNVLWYRGGLWAWQQAGLPFGNEGAMPPAPAGFTGTPAPAGPQPFGSQPFGGQPSGSQPSGFQPSPGQPPAVPPRQGPPPPQNGAQGVAFTLGEFGRGLGYGRNGDWTKTATPEGALVVSNRDSPSGWLTNTIRQPPVPFTLQMEVASGFPAQRNKAVGAGVVFAYNRTNDSDESFYALLVAGNTAVLYRRHDGGFEELSRTTGSGLGGSGGGPAWATLRVTVRTDGFSFSVNGNGEVSQGAEGTMTGGYGVMASGQGEAAFRNLQLR